MGVGVGLGFTHCDAHWTYSGFGRFRRQLASAAGIHLENMIGYGGQQQWDDADVLTVLLHHSDCDGHIEPFHGVALAARIRHLVADWDDDDLDADKHNAMLLAEGLTRAACDGQRLEFC